MAKVKIGTITMIPTDELIPYENNAKEHPEKQIEEIAKSIDQFGFADPVGIWHNENGEPEIVTGHGSVLAAKKRGIEEVPCVILDELTDEERRQFCHIHNITTLSSGIDYDIFKADFNALGMDFNDWEEFGYDGPELYDEDDVQEVEPPAEDELDEQRVRRGDVWQLGNHRVMCGDSTNADDIARLMDGAKADLLLTDPPYNVDYHSADGKSIENDSFGTSNDFVRFLCDALQATKPALTNTACFYIWYADKTCVLFEEAVAKSGFEVKQHLVWNKNTFTLGFRDYQYKHEPCLYGWLGSGHYFTKSRSEQSVIEDTKPIGKMTKDELLALVKHYQDTPTTVIDCEKPFSSKEHPTMKPIKLMAYQIRNSTKPGWLVLDIFGGSGSTLMAAEQTGRTCYTMELDEHYCEVILKRWEEFTGRKAVKVG